MALDEEAEESRQRAAADREARVSNLVRKTAVQEWLCRIALEAVGDDFWRALNLGLAQELQKVFGDGPNAGSENVTFAAHQFAVELDTRAHEEVRTRATHDGRAEALVAVKRGDIHLLTAGLTVGCGALCPRCLTSQYGWFPSRQPDATWLCPTCGTRRIPVFSTGCEVEEKTLPFNAAFNATIEEHLRATVNPAFRLEVVRDEGRVAGEDGVEPDLQDIAELFRQLPEEGSVCEDPLVDQDVGRRTKK